ncbi:hypothetical protein [Halalkalibacter hemicellulosilyticus]|uniref:Uncharacterized protein n=1 Tax=Halalkalibacter hemicellulosilyticusJCM 9152 TaxID=1236971 RepID=W4QIN4_9BACI|nr:hypothetical protein [Halalkalibacter hemicellulosilyticus]GAE31931.1 hypothetical protein JCM9152_3431 [Halalkalibacter hemicellulosilyticusJCM 9152]
MTNVQINSTNIRYQDGDISRVDVYFHGRNARHTYSVTGYIPLTAKEYQGNEALAALTELVVDKLMKGLRGEEDTEVELEAE